MADPSVASIDAAASSCIPCIALPVPTAVLHSVAVGFGDGGRGELPQDDAAERGYDGVHHLAVRFI